MPTARACTVLALALILSACGAKIPQNHYYTLQAAPAPPPAAAPSNVSVAVMRFTAGSQALAQDRLVYREGSNKVDFYEYHRWVDSPADMATQNVLDHLRQSGLFKSVRNFAGTSDTDFLLRGRVENMEEVDADSAVSARVVLSVELLDSKTKAVVWSGRGAQESSIGERSVDSLVRALNSGLNQSSAQIVQGLSGYLQQRR